MQGLRSLADVTLELEGMTVLIGENGTGKTAILEALELIGRASQVLRHTYDVFAEHGGRSLLRFGAERLKLHVRIGGGGEELEYWYVLKPDGVLLMVEEEGLHALDRGGKRKRVLERVGTQVHVYTRPTTSAPSPAASTPRRGRLATRGLLHGRTLTVHPTDLALPRLGVGIEPPPAVRRALAALEGLEIHFGLETRPLWLQQPLGIRSGPRWPSMLEPAPRLERFGVNLPSALQHLRNQSADWQTVVELASLGLGQDLREFVLQGHHGRLELLLRFATFPDHPIPVEALSAGQLSYLCFVVLCRLGGERSLLAIDEPELHLHPGLAARTAWLLEEAARQSPVVVATHSSRLLDALEDPAKSVVLCELDPQRRTVLRRPDPDALKDWLEAYDGIGAIRDAGYERHVFASTGKAS